MPDEHDKEETEMTAHKGRPKLRAFCQRLVAIVDKLCGQTTAWVVDTWLQVMTTSAVDETVRRIRRMLKDADFVVLANRMNLAGGPFKDPKTAEKALSTRLKAPGMAEWPTRDRWKSSSRQRRSNLRKRSSNSSG